MENRYFKKPYKRQLNSTKQYDHFRTLGAMPLPQFPATLLAPRGPQLNQTKNDCTAESAVGERFGFTQKEYDHEAYWQDELKWLKVPDAPDGVDLETKMMVGVRVGFVIPGSADHVDPAKAYFWVKKVSSYDWFDSMRLAMFQLNQKYGLAIPVTIGVNWYSEWDNTPNGVLGMDAKTLLGGHDTELAGFETFVEDSKDYIVNYGTWGSGCGDNGIFRIPRDVFNKFFVGFGAMYWSDDATLVPAKMNFIVALCQNVIILLKRLIAMKSGYPPPVTPSVQPAPVPSQPSRIDAWAKAIMPQEGAKPELNNPGNLKFTTLTASWGGEKGFAAKDGGSICKFATPEQGFTALCNFLTLAAQDELLAFHNARTLRLFTKIYAAPPNDNYAKAVAYALKVDVDYPISKLL